MLQQQGKRCVAWVAYVCVSCCEKCEVWEQGRVDWIEVWFVGGGALLWREAGIQHFTMKATEVHIMSPVCERTENMRSTAVLLFLNVR